MEYEYHCEVEVETNRWEVFKLTRSMPTAIFHCKQYAKHKEIHKGKPIRIRAVSEQTPRKVEFIPFNNTIENEEEAL